MTTPIATRARARPTTITALRDMKYPTKPDMNSSALSPAGLKREWENSSTQDSGHRQNPPPSCPPEGDAHPPSLRQRIPSRGGRSSAPRRRERGGTGLPVSWVLFTGYWGYLASVASRIALWMAVATAW